jgi:hypothetical protein
MAELTAYAIVMMPPGHLPSSHRALLTSPRHHVETARAGSGSHIKLASAAVFSNGDRARKFHFPIKHGLPVPFAGTDIGRCRLYAGVELRKGKPHETC